jgi:hypothetical protein
MQDQRGGAVAVLVPRPVTADGSELARPSGDRELAWLRHEAPAQLTSHAIRLTFDSDYETVLAAKVRQRVGFAGCLALVLLMLPVVVRSTEEMLKPTAGTSVLR